MDHASPLEQTGALGPFSDVVALTQLLVRTPSVYRPESSLGNERAVAGLIRDYAIGLGADVQWLEVADDRPVVVADLDFGNGGPTLLFDAHTDTVTAGDTRLWNYDPFGGEIEDGYLHGRGSLDTKGNLACALIAARELIRNSRDVAGRIILCFPCDEEDRMLGIKGFISAGLAHGIDGAIVCEPEANRVCIAQKGAMRWRVHIEGRMAHGAMPRSGANPIPRAARVIDALGQMEQEACATTGADVMLGWPSFTPTVLQAPVVGDAQLNVMPSSCLIGIDVRTIPGQDHQDLVREMSATLDRLAAEDPSVSASLELIEDRPWTMTPKESPIVTAVAGAVRTVLGSEPTYDGVPGTTDGTYLHLQGIPIVTTGAGDRELPHQANERVRIAELLETTAIYVAAARAFLLAEA